MKKSRKEWRAEAKRLRRESLDLHRELRETRQEHEKTRQAMLEALEKVINQGQRIKELEKCRGERVAELEDMVAVRDSRRDALLEQVRTLMAYKARVRAISPDAHAAAMERLGADAPRDDGGRGDEDEA